MVSRRKFGLGVGGIIIGSSAWYKKNTIMTRGLQVKDYTTTETILGGISYTVNIQNINPVSSAEGKIVTLTTFQDGDAIRQSKDVKVSSMETKEFTILINPSLDDRLSESKYDSSVWVE
jgi:hypothetical protein